jgi:hypothetical protein
MPEPCSPGGVDDKGRKKPMYFAFEIAAIRVADYGETECEVLHIRDMPARPVREFDWIHSDRQRAGLDALLRIARHGMARTKKGATSTARASQSPGE